MTEDLLQSWDIGGALFDNLILDTYNYDVNNNLTELLRQTWDSLIPEWSDYAGVMYTFAYDANNSSMLRSAEAEN